MIALFIGQLGMCSSLDEAQIVTIANVQVSLLLLTEQPYHWQLATGLWNFICVALEMDLI